MDNHEFTNGIIYIKDSRDVKVVAIDLIKKNIVFLTESNHYKNSVQDKALLEIQTKYNKIMDVLK